MVFFTLTNKDYFGGRVLLVSGDNPAPQNFYDFDALETQGDAGSPMTRGSPKKSQAKKTDDHSLLSVVL